MDKTEIQPWKPEVQPGSADSGAGDYEVLERGWAQGSWGHLRSI